MTRPDVTSFATGDDAARAGATFIADVVRARVASAGQCHIAVSGGRTPWTMLAGLAAMDLPFDQVAIYQVDERIVPDGDDRRNLTLLVRSLGERAACVRAMPVTDDDLDAAAARYAAGLPEAFDLVHLGIGPDGHTASLVPGDPVLDVDDRLVATTGEYEGTRRMTLTYPALARAAQVLWLVAGEDKRPALARLLDGDRSIPAGRVRAPHAVVLCDAAAL